MIVIPAFSKARVLVVGDLMLDRYWYGDAKRISPEAPVPVVNVGREQQRPGGAANVALNLAAVGAQVSLLGVVGQDPLAKALTANLEQAGVKSYFVESSSHPTIDKLRIISGHQQLIRLDAEGSFADENAFDKQQLNKEYERLLERVDVVVCSDYGKGTLADIRPLIERARAAGKTVLVDPKGSDWQRYQGATLLTPNRDEFEQVAGASYTEDDLAKKAQDLRESLQMQALLITRSAEGMTLFSRKDRLHLPTHAQEVFDVTGAGDTVIALLAASIGVGMNLGQAASIANLAAGLVVAKLGTATTNLDELRKAARLQSQQIRGILSQDDLIAQVKQAKEQGETVVMTNGCFDLLHPGHITYLEQAKALGDWLVVAVNSDESVKRLKGEQRPINNIEHRMQVLRGLAAVDWVVSFSQDTPADLIGEILPDILVKGGDYKTDEIAGAEAVLDAGGEVKVLDFLGDYSSSAIIERMQQQSKGR